MKRMELYVHIATRLNLQFVIGSVKVIARSTITITAKKSCILSHHKCRGHSSKRIRLWITNLLSGHVMIARTTKLSVLFASKKELYLSFQRKVIPKSQVRTIKLFLRIFQTRKTKNMAEQNSSLKIVERLWWICLHLTMMISSTWSDALLEFVKNTSTLAVFTTIRMCHVSTQCVYRDSDVLFITVNNAQLQVIAC